MAYWVMIKPGKGHLDFCLHHGSRDALDHVPLYILKAEHDCPGPVKAVRRRLQYFSLAWIKSGDCRFWSEKQTRVVRVPVGSVIAVGPGLLHAYGGHGQACIEDYVVFFGPVADAYARLGLFDPARPFIKLREPERIAEIAGLFNQGTVEAQLRAGLVLQRMLLVTKFDVPSAAAADEFGIQKLRKRIEASPEVHLSIAEMAACCGLSESHFRKLFRKQVGLAPSRFCEHLRMDLACRALAGSDRRIGEIAVDLGYVDPLYFSQRFSAVIGISPRHYRQSVRGQSCSLDSVAPPRTHPRDAGSAVLPDSRRHRGA
jgi:AraC family transcriptional regulator of arabinose operon